MKKMILIFLAILPNILFAQVCNTQFTYTLDGFRTKADLTKDYIILELQGTNSKDNFSQLKSIFSKEVLNTKTVNIDDSTFVFGLQDAVKLSGVKPLTDMFYSVSISCRDNLVKVQFNCKYFQSWHGMLGGGMTVMGSEFIYKKGKIKNEAAKAEAEKFANNFVKNLETKLKNGDNSW